MELFYEGVNITKEVQITSAKSRDVSGGRADSLDLTLGAAQCWHRWNLQSNDRIELTHNGYSTGELYVNTIAPENGEYRILATALRVGAGRRANGSFEGKTLEDILKISAAECGMDYRIFGLDRKVRYPYLLRKDEGCAAFLNRIAGWEGAVLKTYSGRFTMIGILAAQALPACETISISAKQEGVSYQCRESKLKSLTVKTPFAAVMARDDTVTKGNDRVICAIPAKDPVTAGRWARGILTNENRRAECLTIESAFHSAWSAMVRIDVTGETEANGNWIIDEVEHDFVNGISRGTLLRCVESVV